MELRIKKPNKMEKEIIKILTHRYGTNLLPHRNATDEILALIDKHVEKQLFLHGVVKSSNSFLQVGDDVLYVGKYLGTIIEGRNVELRDGTLIASLDTQPHKFRKVL